MKRMLAMLLALCLLLTLAPAAFADPAEAPAAEKTPAEATDAPAEDEALSEEVPEETGDASADSEAAPAEETPAGEEIPEGQPAGEAPAEEIPEAAPAEETPAEEEIPEEAPAGETPVPEETEAPAGETPVPEETEEPGPETAAALPAVGDVVHGFEAKEIREFPAIGAQVVLFEHQRTGSKLMYIANDDVNRAFQLTFLTDAIDNTGLPHVFEHSVLDGSEKYPSKALFFNLTAQSYNTYMNAYTGQLMTGYPIASLSEAQLLKLADFYTDSCLHPMVLEDESIYREEAWRYRLADADSSLTIEGTVYSEMLGAHNLRHAASYNAARAAFPGSRVGNVSGGDPAFIPDMTFEDLRSYHEKYYHPSNCIAYLYGEFEDYAAFLALLDEAYGPFERREFVREDPDYAPITEPVEVSVGFPVEAGSSAEDASVIYYEIVCPGAKNTPDELVLNTLTDLLTDNASRLQQSLQEALPGGTFYSFIETEAADAAIVFMGENLNPGDAGLFRDTVDAALRQVAEEGFPQDQVDGVMASLNINTLLTREASNVGVEGVFSPMASYYASNGSPWGYLEYVEGMTHMDEWNRQGLYAKAVKDWLLDKPTIALCTTYPEPGRKEENDAALAARLEEVKAAMSDGEIAALVEASNAEDAPEDNAAMVASLQAVTVDSLPEELKLYDCADEVGEDGIRRIDVEAQVDGVGQAAVFLDAAGVAQEDLHWLQLLADLVGSLDTSSHTKAELAALQSRYLNGGRVYISLPGKRDDFHPYLRMSWIALDDDLAMGYDLMRELVFDQNVDDAQKVLEAVKGTKNALRKSVIDAPYSIQLTRAIARTSGLNRYLSYVKQLDYYDFLCEVEQRLETEPEAVSARLRAIQAQMNNRTNAVTIYAGSAAGIAANRGLADAFLGSLGEAPVEPVAYDLPVPAASEALIVDGGVSFNGEYADYAVLDLEGFEGGMSAVTSLVQDAFLYPMLRDKYGAYGVFHSADENDGVYVISYRDPNIAQTFGVYEQLHDLVSGLDVEQDALNGYILSAYSGLAMPMGELSGALSAALDALQGEPQDRALEYMRALKAVTPDTVKRYADLYGKLDAEGVKFTAGPASAINAEADRYEVILNPFGAVDYSQAGFEDVAEGDEAYGAVLSALENNLMAPLSETRFGADEPATEGDALGALYVLAGGEAPDAGAAVEAFAQYGLSGLEPDAELTGAGLDELLGWFSGGAWESRGGDEPLTRAGLAQALAEFGELLAAAQNAA